MRRTEFPDPQRRRSTWQSLNGSWEFEIDNEKDGFSRGLLHNKLASKIEVPFSPECELSGIRYTDFIRACWYRRTFSIPSENRKGRIVLCFGTVDFEAKVYINGSFVGGHRGGYTPFSFDITALIDREENEIVVYVEDDISANLPSGKQSPKRESFGCFYTRTTGIWQSVYLEFTPAEYIRSFRFYPDAENGRVEIETVTVGKERMNVQVFYEGRLVGQADSNGYFKNRINIELSEKHLWEAGRGRLYDVRLTFGEDIVESYFGLRSVEYREGKFLLNGKSVFQRFALIQGYYPEGVYTPAALEEMEKDLNIATEFGFNGLRLHQKVFDPYFLYLCDKRGIMVWGEFPSWGVRYSDLEGLGELLTEWREVLQRDFNHPSIVTWCPLNEAWEDLDDSGKIRDVRFVDIVYEFTKKLDSTRPCVDVSGGYHGEKTDLFDYHDYGNFEGLKARIKKLEIENMLYVDKLYAKGENRFYKSGEAVNLSEYGGMTIGNNVKAEITDCVQETSAWGYDAAPGEQEFTENYIKMTGLIMSCKKISGFCYTQLYDVEQEQNGLVTYNRRHKISEENREKIAECNRRKAAIED
jgi:beta-galactosidase